MAVTIDDVRALATRLPRSYEVVVRRRVKFRVGQIVYLAFSEDEKEMGFAFPKEERDAALETFPDKFIRPRESDMRFQWLEVRLDAIDEHELRELVFDAWRMVVPKKLAALSDEELEKRAAARLAEVDSSDIDFALALADLADSLSLPRFRAHDLVVETKPDLTPVSDADRAVERALRERIAADRPGDGVLGEEEGDAGGDVRWVIDPIDGTKNFARGVPVWATLIGLERGGAVVCGVVSAPALGHRWWAARGKGAFRDGDRIGVSSVSDLADASLSATYGRDLVSVEASVWHARSVGDFWQHMLVAEGALDAAIDARLAPWDYTALIPIVEEAGGRLSSLDGGPPQPGEQVVSSNPTLHADVLALLNH